MTELQALRAEAARQDAIAQVLRAERAAAIKTAESIHDQASIEAGIAWARAEGLHSALDAAIANVRSAISAQSDIEDPDGLRSEA